MVVTVGPACQSVEVLTKLLQTGMACARIDLTWGGIEFHRNSLRNLAAAMKATKKLCAVWIDTAGREIVVSRPYKADISGWNEVDKTPIIFEEGSEVVITTRQVEDATSNVLPVSVKELPGLVFPGQVMQVGRFMSTGAEGGSLFLKVVSVTDTDIICKAENSASLVGVLTILVSHREFELTTHSQDLNEQIPLMTEQDLDFIRTFGKEFEIDYLSLSYCNAAADVMKAREILDSFGMEQTKIIAKVERKAAIHNFEDIIIVADGILLSRGNLGLDFEPEEMANLQKKCILRCNALARPIILTRFVDTMVNTPRPTRAEATDVANAVLDGVDGVMLGAETLRGLYPIETVDTVSKLCGAAERYFDYRTHHEDLMGEAYEEELDLERTSFSVSDLRQLERDAVSSMRGFRAIKISDSSPTTSEPDFGSPSHVGGGSPTGVAKASSFGVIPRGGSSDALSKIHETGAPYLSKVESIASSAVRSAEKINAGLIVVFAQSGRTASLVSKYRPPMPVLSVVVPTLQSDKLNWKIEGKYLARQCLIMRGIRPVMAAPMSTKESGLLEEAVSSACQQELVKANDYVVAILSEHGNFVVKIVRVNSQGDGITTHGDASDLASLSTLATLPSFVTPPTSPSALDGAAHAAMK